MNEVLTILSNPVLLNTAQLGVVAVMATLPSYMVGYFLARDKFEDQLKKIFEEIQRYNYQLAIELRHQK